MAAPECQWYYSFRGVSEGPVPFQALCGFIANHLIPTTSYVWNPVQGGEWRKLADVPEFAGALSAALRRKAPVRGEDLLALAKMLDAVHDGTEHRPRIKGMVKAVWRWMVLALFRPFQFKRWAGIAFCSWLAGTYFLIGVFDKQTFFSELEGGAEGTTAVLLSAHAWAKNLFAGGDTFTWCALAFFYLVMACFIRAKGQLMFLHRIRFPGDSIQAAWTATVGQTFPLAVFHLFVDAILAVIVIGAAMTVFSNLDEAVIRIGDPLKIVQAVQGDAASCHWLAISWYVFLAVSLVRSVVYHFVEPVFYRLRIPLGQAFRVTFRLFKTQFPSIFLFFCSIIVFRIAILVAGGLLVLFVFALGAPLFAVLPFLFPYIIRLVFLPADYFIRSLGPCFLGMWKGLW